MVAQLPTRSVAKWTPQEIDGALIAADSGNLMRAADLVETIMAADDRVSGVLGARTLGMLRLDLAFEGGSDVARTTLTANGKSAWETMHPDAELAQLMSWGIVLGIGLGQRVPLPREAFSGHPQLYTLETWHPRWLYQNVYTHEWRVSHKGGVSTVVAGDGQWIMYQPYGVNRPWAKGAWRALAFAWILKQFALHDRARFSEVYGQPIRVGIAPAGANERMRTRWLAALKNLGRDAALVLPPGYDLKLVEVGAGKGIEVFNQQIEWADRAIAVVLAGQIVTTEGTPGFNKGSIHETIKADTIGFTAKSTSSCLYEQSLKPWAGTAYGDTAAAPKPAWDTTLPEDQGAKVEAMKGAGDAIKTLDDALAPSGLKVNGASIADRFGIPTVTLPPTASKAPTVQLAPTDVAKVVLVNEARAGSGLGPLLLATGGEDPDGKLTVAQFDLKKAAEVQAANPTAGSPAFPPRTPQGPPSPTQLSARLAGNFDESKHPRADDGKFGSGGGGGNDSEGGDSDNGDNGDSEDTDKPDRPSKRDLLDTAKERHAEAAETRDKAVAEHEAASKELRRVQTEQTQALDAHAENRKQLATQADTLAERYKSDAKQLRKDAKPMKKRLDELEDAEGADDEYNDLVVKVSEMEERADSLEDGSRELKKASRAALNPKHDANEAKFREAIKSGDTKTLERIFDKVNDSTSDLSFALLEHGEEGVDYPTVDLEHDAFELENARDTEAETRAVRDHRERVARNRAKELARRQRDVDADNDGRTGDAEKKDDDK